MEKAEEIIKLNKTKEEAKKIKEQKESDDSKITTDVNQADKLINIKENESVTTGVSKNDSEEIIKGSAEKIRGVKVTGQKIDLTQFKEDKKMRKKNVQE